MGADSLIPWLFGMTLVAGLAIGIWQYMRVRRSQERSGQQPGEVLATKHPTRDTNPNPNPNTNPHSSPHPNTPQR
jgi:hypothetical protein